MLIRVLCFYEEVGRRIYRHVRARVRRYWRNHYQSGSGGAITHVGISLTFGLVALAMIYAVGFKSLDLFGRSYRRSFGCCCRLSMRA